MRVVKNCIMRDQRPLEATIFVYLHFIYLQIVIDCMSEEIKLSSPDKILRSKEFFIHEFVGILSR